MKLTKDGRTSDEIARALMSAYLIDRDTTVTIYQTDHAGIVKLYEQDQWLKTVKAWLQSDSRVKAQFDAFVAREKQRGQ
jgi:hypothetical protein